MDNEVSIQAMMESLVKNAAEELPPTALAEVFDRLVWCLKDNGAEIHRIRDTWLRGDDLQRVAIAVAMDEGFPFDGGDRMLLELDRIAVRWPELTRRCDEIIQDWRKTVAARR